jgi:hypothetical protein
MFDPPEYSPNLFVDRTRAKHVIEITFNRRSGRGKVPNFNVRLKLAEAKSSQLFRRTENARSEGNFPLKLGTFYGVMRLAIKVGNFLVCKWVCL